MLRAFAILTALLISVAAHAQSQETSEEIVRLAFQRNANYMRIQDPTIQSELQLTAEQQAQLQRLPEDVRKSNEERLEKYLVAARKRESTLAETVKTFEPQLHQFLSEVQQQRLQQLSRQLELIDLQAIISNQWSKPLNLTDEMKTRFDKHWNQRVREAFENPELKRALETDLNGMSGPADRLKARSDFYVRTIQEYIDTLDDKRRSIWKDHLGESCSQLATLNRFRPTPKYLYRNVPDAESLHRYCILLTQVASLDELKIEQGKRAELMKIVRAIEARVQSIGSASSELASINSRIGLDLDRALKRIATPGQQNRLKQIAFQLQGIASFRMTSFEIYAIPTAASVSVMPPLVSRLALTPKQAKRIDELNITLRNSLEAIERPNRLLILNPTDEDEQDRKYRRRIYQIHHSAIQEILAMFDRGQLAIWKEYAGEPVDVRSLTSALPKSFPTVGTGVLGPSSIAQSWLHMSINRQDYGLYAASLAAIHEALRIAPENPAFLNQKAWLLATCPSESARDVKSALLLAQLAVEKSKDHKERYLDTLAAALAANEKFEEAVKTQEQAIQLMLQIPRETNGTLVVWEGMRQFPSMIQRDMRARLKLYQARKPYRHEPFILESQP